MHANIKTFNIYHKELSIPSNNKTLKLKLVLLHVEFEVCFFFFFFQMKIKIWCYETVKIKDKLMLISNKSNLLPCMALQFAENQHKIIFNLGLQAGMISLFQLSYLRYQGQLETYQRNSQGSPALVRATLKFFRSCCEHLRIYLDAVTFYNQSWSCQCPMATSILVNLSQQEKLRNTLKKMLF